MSIKEILLGIPVLMFVWWVFTAPVPQQRIERVCEPINWVGNLGTSATALATDTHTGTAERWSSKLDYSCQYMIWRLFYQKDYNAAVAAGLIAAPASEASAADAAAPASAASAAGASAASAATSAN
ncbi:hypothetical protein G3A43_06690 [Paraburkholderia aspalathi]|nr:hypothetical protein [Paraburkholderia aspalathi]MBK3779937.1 hypothetical protein [Paraburkholderia aspalathi]